MTTEDKIFNIIKQKTNIKATDIANALYLPEEQVYHILYTKLNMYCECNNNYEWHIKNINNTNKYKDARDTFQENVKTITRTLTPKQLDEETLKKQLKFYRHEIARKGVITKRMKKMNREIGESSATEILGRNLYDIKLCEIEEGTIDRKNPKNLKLQFNEKWNNFIKCHTLNCVYKTKEGDIKYQIQKELDNSYRIITEKCEPFTKEYFEKSYIKGWDKNDLFQRYKRIIRELSKEANEINTNAYTFENTQLLYNVTLLNQSYHNEYNTYNAILHEIID